MSPNRRRRLTILVVLLALGSAGGGAVYRNWRSMRSYVQRERDLAECRESEYPIIRALAGEEIKPGDPIDEVTDRYPPTRVVRHDEFTRVVYQYGNYMAGVELVVVGGLIKAAYEWGICGHGTLFFNSFTPAEEQAFEASFSAYLNERDRVRRDAPLAVAGFGATINPDDLPHHESATEP